VSTLDPNGPELTAYRTAVAAMRQLPSTDPRNWTRQAQIHSNFCPHANWFFLPWHRAYLLYFEAICRELSGEPDFALPYWDWSINPQVPAAFWQQGSPLVHPRDIGPNDPADAEAVGPDVIEEILDNPDFITAVGSGEAPPNPWPAAGHPQMVAYSVLEGTPHNYVHGFIGGDMATFMSPLDPIFWLHHCNIDRIWSEWDARNPGQFPTDQTFNDFALTMFVDETGQAASIKIGQLKDSEALGYNYVAAGAPAPPVEGANILAAEPVVARAALNQAITGNSAPMAALQASPEVQERLMAVANMAPDAPTGRVIVTVDDIRGDLSPGIGVRAFLNCDYLSPLTPPVDPHYIGTIFFFGLDHAAGGHGDHGKLSYYLDATRTVARLAQQKQFAAEAPLRVGFTKVPLPGRRSLPETPVDAAVQIREVAAAVY
jgi:tyrosinase